jgi:hypothetical protein
MANVTGTCNPTISFTQVGQLGTDPAGSIPEALSFRGNFTTSGSALNQVQKIHAKTYTLAASTPQTPDLTSLLDISGATISFTTIDLIAYRIQSVVDTFTVTLGAAGANEWNGWLTSGSKVIAFPSTTVNDGYTIVQAPNTTGMAVGGSSKLLKIDPGTNAVGAFDLILIGR